jgi:bifunctional non-homologous end joining protein LigD
MKIGVHDVAITNEDKIMFPVSGITKGDLIKYYKEVSELMIKYSSSHPVTLHRFPNGISNKEFIQKNVSAHFPDWIPTVKVEKKGGFVEMAMINNEETLIYLTNQGSIVYHTWLSNQHKLHFPDRMIIDLDPAEDGHFKKVAKAARMIRKIYDDLELPCFLMTTGSKGLHIVTPLSEKAGYDEVKGFARALCQHVATLCPNDTTIEIRKDKRKGRVFLDYLRNAYAQTGVAPYSVRAIENAPVAVPLFCEELDNEKLHSQFYTIHNLAKRLDKKGDPWEGFDRLGFSISRLYKKLETLVEHEENKSN